MDSRQNDQRTQSRDGHRPSEERAVPPPLPEQVAGADLDPAVHAELRTLAKPIAAEVAAHLVAAGVLLDDDPVAALAHARFARSRAPRIGAIREAAGIAAYAAGEYSEALAELRAARRMGADPANLALIADCERALGRPEHALRAAEDPFFAGLDRADRIEVLLVVAGARRDLGQHEAALGTLHKAGAVEPSAGDELDASRLRLRYAYAETLEEMGRRAEAADWFDRAAALDTEAETDAPERAAALRG